MTDRIAAAIDAALGCWFPELLGPNVRGVVVERVERAVVAVEDARRRRGKPGRVSDVEVYQFAFRVARAVTADLRVGRLERVIKAHEGDNSAAICRAIDRIGLRLNTSATASQARAGEGTR